MPISHIVQYEDKGAVESNNSKDVTAVDICKGYHKARDEAQ
jgi:hypothetical protein